MIAPRFAYRHLRSHRSTTYADRWAKTAEPWRRGVATRGQSSVELADGVNIKKRKKKKNNRPSTRPATIHNHNDGSTHRTRFRSRIRLTTYFDYVIFANIAEDFCSIKMAVPKGTHIYMICITTGPQNWETKCSRNGCKWNGTAAVFQIQHSNGDIYMKS